MVKNKNDEKDEKDDYALCEQDHNQLVRLNSLSKAQKRAKNKDESFTYCADPMRKHVHHIVLDICCFCILPHFDKWLDEYLVQQVMKQM